MHENFHDAILWEFLYDTARLTGFRGTRWEYWLRDFEKTNRIEEYRLMSDSGTALSTLLAEHKDAILQRFPKLNDWLTPEIWFSVVEQLRNDPKLNEAARTNPNSVLSALLTLADWGLKPDRSEAFINVYKIDGVLTAQAQWIWQGGVRRAVDSGVIAHAVADVIREGDSIEEIVDQKGRHLTHKRDIARSNRKLIGSYALFWLKNGLMDYELCDLADIERAKEASKRQVGKLTPAWQYSEPEQAKKTAIRRGLKRMVGKRDAAFESMVNTHFDAETTAHDPGELTPDETPRARVSLSHDSQQGNPAVAPLRGSETAAVIVEGQDEERPEDSGDASTASLAGGDAPSIEDVKVAFKKNPKIPAVKFQIIKDIVLDWDTRGGLEKLTPTERTAVVRALQ